MAHVRRCAALCAIGVVLGMVGVLSELSFHVERPTGAVVALALVSGCGGLAGLVVPVWLVRRRVYAERHRQASDRSSSAPLTLDFAATLVAGILIATGVLWGVLCGGALFLEDFRRALAVRCMWPAAARLVVLQSAVLCAVAVAALLATMALVALHGWYRSVSGSQPEIAKLWRAMLLASAAGGAAAELIPSAAVRALLAVLSILIAALLASRHDHGAALPVSIPRAADTFSARLSWTLPGAALAAGCAGFAFVQACATASRGLPQLGLLVCVSGVAAAGGVWVGGRLAVRGLPVEAVAAGALGLSVVAAGASALGGSVAGVIGLAAAAAGASSLCVVALGRWLVRNLNNIQRALVMLGGAAAVGISASAAIVGLASRGAETLRPSQTASGSLADVLRAAASLRAFSVGAAMLGGPAAVDADADAWRIDLHGSKYDLLWIDVAGGALAESDDQRGGLRRVLRRCGSALLWRGRMVLALPDGAAARASDFASLLSAGERGRARLIRVQRGAERLELFVLGGGVDAWWAAVPLPTGVTASIAPFDASEFRTLQPE